MSDYPAGETIGELIDWAEHRGAHLHTEKELVELNRDMGDYEFRYLVHGRRRVALPVDAEPDMRIHPMMGNHIIERLRLKDEGTLQ